MKTLSSTGTFRSGLLKKKSRSRMIPQSPSDKYVFDSIYDDLDIVSVRAINPIPPCEFDCLRSHPEVNPGCTTHTHCFYMVRCPRIDMIELAELLYTQPWRKPCSKS